MGMDELKAKQAESQTPAATPEAQQPEPRMSLRDAIKHFESEAAKAYSGAPSRAQKQELFVVPEETIKANPGADFRWVSPSKVQQRLSEGYVVVSAAEGGRRIGDEHILMGIPKGLRAMHRAADKERRESRLKAHVGEMEQAAEAVVRELRDNHGVKISTEELLRA
jgi:hypothetical protein